MSGVNKAIIVGRLGQDPEVRYMSSGEAVANLSVATSETWKDKQGQKQERTEWHRVSIFGKLAEIAGQYLKKGSMVYLEGKIQTRKWQDQQGQDRYTTEIVLTGFDGKMQMLGGGDNATPKTPQQSQQPAMNQQQPNPRSNNQPQQNKPPMAEPDFDFDDDIPFAPMFKQFRSMHYAC